MSDAPGPSVDPTHQLVIVARLAEFCQFRAGTPHEGDPWSFMLRKLSETQEPLTALKGQLFAATRSRLLAEAKSGELGGERCADYRALFERLVSPGDFADVAIHLAPGAPNQAQALAGVLASMRPTNLFLEEAKEGGARSPSWDKLVGELSRRLDLERMGQVLTRKPVTARRRAMVLRRVRSNVAEYCTVVRIPTNPQDTFTPFKLPRVEALIAACLRFLRKHR